MELSKEAFEEITGLCLLPQADGQQHERRKHSRISFGTRARISPLFGEEKCVPVMVRDISQGGLGFLHAESMSVGDEFLIHLPGDLGKPAKIHCIVHRCEPGGMGGQQFLIGATFEQVLEPALPAAQPAEAMRCAAVEAPLPAAAAPVAKSKNKPRLRIVAHLAMPAIKAWSAVRSALRRDKLAARAIPAPSEVSTRNNPAISALAMAMDASLVAPAHEFVPVSQPDPVVAAPMRAASRTRPRKRPAPVVRVRRAAVEIPAVARRNSNTFTVELRRQKMDQPRRRELAKAVRGATDVIFNCDLGPAP